MKRALRYFYFRLYNYYASGSGDPFVSFCASAGVLIIFNFFTLIVLIEMFFNFKLFYIPTQKKGSLGYFWPLLFLVPFYFFLDFLIRKKGLHDSIMEEFKAENRKEKWVSSILVILYFVLTMGFLFLALWLRQMVRGH